MRKGTKDVSKATTEIGRNTIQKPKNKAKNGCKQARSGTDEISRFGVHLLAGKLRSIPLYEMMHIKGNTDTYKPLHIVKTEGQRLQAIEDLYAIIKAQPEYKKLIEPKWSADNSTFDVLNWIFRKLHPLAKTASWTIDTYQDAGKTRYRFVAFSEYYTYVIKDREEIVTLDFLPTLKRKDQALHDLIVDTIAYVTKICNMPLWDEDIDFSKGLDELLNHKGDKAVIDRYREIYTTGIAAEYLRLLKTRQEEVTASDITKSIKEYDSNSQRKNSLIWLIKLGLKLNGDIKEFSFTPNYLDNSVSAFQLYKFVWSQKEDDLVNIFTNISARWGDTSYLPVQFSVTHPGEVCQPIQYSSFPIDLYRFMAGLVSHTHWSHSSYYYPKSKKAAKEVMPLLEILELQEIKDEVKAGLYE